MLEEKKYKYNIYFQYIFSQVIDISKCANPVSNLICNIHFTELENKAIL